MNKALISYISKNVVVETLYCRHNGLLSYIGENYIILTNASIGLTEDGKDVFDEKVINISNIVAVYKDIYVKNNSQ